MKETRSYKKKLTASLIRNKQTSYNDQEGVVIGSCDIWSAPTRRRNGSDDHLGRGGCCSIF